MKIPVEWMTPVELLAEFNDRYVYMRRVKQARDQGGEVVPQYPGDTRGFVVLSQPGQPPMGVRVPSPEAEERWNNLCAEINRRFSGVEREV